MPSGKKPVNCVPCAKRKVRCDRLQPCCHCRRRPQDQCTYPVADTTHGQSPLDQAQRIQKLESYIQSLGGDLGKAARLDIRHREGSSGASLSSDVSGRNSRSSVSTPAAIDSVGKTSGIVTHDDEVTYVETPMWYSWSGSTQPEQDSSSSPARQGQRVNTHPRDSSFYTTILNCGAAENGNQSLRIPTAHMLPLWKTYLTNVHPLVGKVFFDWEVQPLIHRACQQDASFTDAERALVTAIVCITTLSLSEDECVTLFRGDRAKIFAGFKKDLEHVLLRAQYATTNSRLTFQALMLYLISLRDRAHPAAIFALVGVASRIAERMGLHRDGAMLGLSVLRSEERRRMWWQLQSIELVTARLVGTMSMTVFADWDSRLPANLEDTDLSPETQNLPEERVGITSMSPCLWQYHILHNLRSTSHPHAPTESMSWMLSPQVALAAKDARIDIVERLLGTKFVQYCDLLNPLHVHIQIGIRQFVLAGRRTGRQPALVNAKISEMSRQERDEFLGLCTKGFDYFIMSQNAESLRGFRWQNENYFQWSAFVYVILEAHHRSKEESVADLWELIRKVFAAHPELKAAVHRPETDAVARITLAAWQRHAAHVLEQRLALGGSSTVETPQWIVEMCRDFELPQIDAISAADANLQQQLTLDASQLLGVEFDFDMLDWSAWGEVHLSARPYED